MTTETALKPRGLFLRKLKNFTVIGVSAFGTVIAAVFLIWILWTILRNGAESLSVEFLTQPTKPYGVPGGGMLNAILGTALITLVATLLAVPAGMLGGVCLSEFARSSRFGNAVRFSANVMMGMPSIIVGLFIYTLIVMTTGRFSGFAGSVALAIIMFPVILRTTEDMLCMVPNALRESALAHHPRSRLPLGEKRTHDGCSARRGACRRRNRAAAFHRAHQRRLADRVLHPADRQPHGHHDGIRDKLAV